MKKITVPIVAIVSMVLLAITMLVYSAVVPVQAHGTATGAKVYNPAQSVPNATWTALAFGGENWDDNAFHDTSVNNSRLTIPSGLAGRYLIGCTNLFVYGATGDRGISITKNGAYIAMQTHPHTNNTGYGNHLTLNIIDDAAVGDYYQCFAWQNNGAALNTATPSNFWLEKVN